MSTTTKTLTKLLALLVLTIPSALAQSPSITVKNQDGPSGRRLEIVVLETSRMVRESPGEAIADAGPVSPDGGQIVGTTIAGGKRYAITQDKLLAVGDKLGGHRITAVSLDRVTMSAGAHAYTLDVHTGEWTVDDPVDAAD